MCERESFVVAYLLFNWIRNFDECFSSILNAKIQTMMLLVLLPPLYLSLLSLLFIQQTQKRKVGCDSAVCDGMIVIFYYLIWQEMSWLSCGKLAKQIIIIRNGYWFSLQFPFHSVRIYFIYLCHSFIHSSICALFPFISELIIFLTTNDTILWFRKLNTNTNTNIYISFHFTSIYLSNHPSLDTPLHLWNIYTFLLWKNVSRIIRILPHLYLAICSLLCVIFTNYSDGRSRTQRTVIRFLQCQNFTRCVAPIVLLNIRNETPRREFISSILSFLVNSFSFSSPFFPAYVLTFFASHSFSHFISRETREWDSWKWITIRRRNEWGAFPIPVQCAHVSNPVVGGVFWVDSNYCNTIGINFKMFRSKKTEIVGDLLTKADT